MRYLITGNTGFKGSWLSLILNEFGHEVYGLALKPENQSLFEFAGIKDCITKQFYSDIREYNNLKTVIRQVQPDVVIHFAAQPLVRESYVNPRNTIETNVMGTFNLLEALTESEKLKATLIITTDKVYKNIEQLTGYREDDALGGHDPYSSSKAMADLATQSWILSFPGPPIQVVRAGNVIGGGDFGRDRLIPDIVRSIENSNSVRIRFPNSVRPWQHVFDCLGGYLKLVDYSLTSRSSEVWNIGPDQDSIKSVSDVLSEVSKYLSFQSNLKPNVDFHESGLLTLNSKKIKTKLKWENAIQFSESIEITGKWYLDYLNGKDLRKISLEQINKYFKF